MDFNGLYLFKWVCNIFREREGNLTDKVKEVPYEDVRARRSSKVAILVSYLKTLPTQL